MFADPQSVTVNAVAVSVPTIRRDDTSSTYRSDDRKLTLKISHQEGKRDRRNVRLDFEKIAADPFTPSVNQTFNGSVYLVIDVPKTGFTNAEIQDHVQGLTDWLTEANTLKVLGGQS